MSRYMREVSSWRYVGFFFFQAEDGIRDADVTAVQTCALPIFGLFGHGEPVLPGLSTSIILISSGAVAVLLLVSLFKPVLNAAVGILPLAGLALVLAAGLPSPERVEGLTPGIAVHALSSLLAFAVLAIAAVQAVLLGLQNRALRQHHIRGLVQALPPLTRSEERRVGKEGRSRWRVYQ